MQLYTNKFLELDNLNGKVKVSLVEIKRGIKGMTNTQNNCFVNAVL
jgi:ubiquitin C-terminal hydrolase